MLTSKWDTLSDGQATSEKCDGYRVISLDRGKSMLGPYLAVISWGRFSQWVALFADLTGAQSCTGKPVRFIHHFAHGNASQCCMVTVVWWVKWVELKSTFSTRSALQHISWMQKCLQLVLLNAKGTPHTDITVLFIQRALWYCHHIGLPSCVL